MKTAMKARSASVVAVQETNVMQRHTIAGLTAFFAAFAAAGAALPAGNLAEQEPIEVRVQLGTEDGDLKFVPDSLAFETGKLYKLVLTNPSKMKHYFTSLGLASRVYSRKVQVVDEGGTKAEIKGDIREIEVYPGGTAEWWFVPVATGELDDLHCHVKEEDGHTHAEKGMIGTIAIR
jgi:uncharacterized cupredoxin-like copper-binding protein